MNKRLWLGLLLGLLWLAACNSGTTQPPPSGGGGDTTPTVDAREVAATLDVATAQVYALMQPFAMAGMPLPIFFVPLSDGALALDEATWDCDSVTASGDLTDADADGVPVAATLNGRCSWSYSGPEGASSGYWEYVNLVVRDPNDNDPNAGVSASGQVVLGVTTPEETMTLTWTLNRHEFVKEGASFRFAYEGRWDAELSAGSITTNYAFNGTWVPDDAANPWGDGTLNGNGNYSGAGPSCPSWSVSTSVTNVHYTGGKIDAGSASFSGTDCDGETSSGTVTWTASEVCITVEGQQYCYPNE